MADTFAKLEQSLKTEMTTIHGFDLGQILTSVEDTEEKLDNHASEIEDLKKQVRNLQLEQRNMLYKLDDQENRSRRKNLGKSGVYQRQRKKTI